MHGPAAYRTLDLPRRAVFQMPPKLPSCPPPRATVRAQQAYYRGQRTHLAESTVGEKQTIEKKKSTERKTNPEKQRVRQLERNKIRTKTRAKPEQTKSKKTIKHRQIETKTGQSKNKTKRKPKTENTATMLYKNRITRHKRKVEQKLQNMNSKANHFAAAATGAAHALARPH